MFEALIKKFKKEEEVSLPQVRDFPKTKYSGYWEIIEIPEGKEIRFMSYKKGLVNTVRVNHDPRELARVINVFMKDFEVV